MLFRAFRLASRIRGTLMAESLMIGAGLIAVSGTLAMIFGRHPSQDVVGAECSVSQPLYPEADEIKPDGGRTGVADQ